MATTAEKLANAESKLEQLLTGSLRSSVRDGDSEMKFTPADAGELRREISILKSKLKQETNPTAYGRRPAGVIF